MDVVILLFYRYNLVKIILFWNQKVIDYDYRDLAIEKVAEKVTEI